jgi:hypothetical protein
MADHNNNNNNNNNNASIQNTNQQQRSLLQQATYVFYIVAAYYILKSAYTIRLVAIEEFGPVIHEFDPYFNFRATEVRWWLSAGGAVVLSCSGLPAAAFLMHHSDLCSIFSTPCYCCLDAYRYDRNNSICIGMDGDDSFVGLTMMFGTHWADPLVPPFIPYVRQLAGVTTTIGRQSTKISRTRYYPI